MTTRSPGLAAPALILAAARRHRQVRQEGVGGLAAPVGEHHTVPGGLGQGDSLQGLAEGADLVGLDEDALPPSDRCPSGAAPDW